jgi:CheY-like chemotaxis protein
MVNSTINRYGDSGFIRGFKSLLSNLVDDSEDDLELIQYILNLTGMHVDQARNGQEALEKFQ